MVLNIFVGEDEAYRNYVEKTFEEIDGDKPSITIIQQTDKIPLGYDIYLLHIAHYGLDKIEKLISEQQKSIIMIRNATGGIMPLATQNKEGFPWEKISGFYGPGEKNKFTTHNRKNLAKKCLDELNLLKIK